MQSYFNITDQSYILYGIILFVIPIYIYTFSKTTYIYEHCFFAACSACFINCPDLRITYILQKYVRSIVQNGFSAYANVYEKPYINMNFNI